MKERKRPFQQQVHDLINENHGPFTSVYMPEPLLRFCGDLDTALFLSKLIYWCDKGKAPDGWIYKTASEWFKEIGISEHKLKQVKLKLTKSGLLELKKKMANGSNTWHYRLLRVNFLDWFLKFLKNETGNLSARTLIISASITKTTTQINTEITENSKQKKQISLKSEKQRNEDRQAQDPNSKSNPLDKYLSDLIKKHDL